MNGPADPDDETLVASALRGDDQAFAVLAGRHKRKIFGMAARFFDNPSDREDLAQEVFIKAWRALGTYRAGAPFEHWLSRIAIRACYDALRKSRRQPPTAPIEAAAAALSETTNASARDLIHSGLARLSPPERLVLTLLELEGHSVREISQATGWSEANVKVRAFRARSALKHILESRHE
ncbi:MAG: sigma-70 family RNA polymerase sigma factor [Verrucomicrobia bacterium]|nr:sigma-70 family RNA polymerase sigma factor [Verrucomicrobiota bacterium]